MEFCSQSSSSTSKWRRERLGSMEFTTFLLIFFLFLASVSCGTEDKLIYASLKTESYAGRGMTEKHETYTEHAGTYGHGSKVNFVSPITGQLVHVQTKDNKSDLGCSTLDPAIVPKRRWIALVLRGDCNFSDKIYYAAKQSNASAVIIYDFKDSEIAGDKKILFDAKNGKHDGRYSQYY